MEIGPLSPLQATERSMGGAWARPRPTGAAISWRAALLAALMLATIALTVTLVPRGGPAAGPAARDAFGHAQALARSRIASELTLAERAQIAGRLAAATPQFRAVHAGGGLRMTNRARGLTAEFDRSGAMLVAGGASIAISPQTIGSGPVSLAVGEATPSTQGNRVTYTRGLLSEWYRNGPLGIEQGFTIPRAPAGLGGTLTLTMSLSGNARATLSRDVQSVVLRHASSSLSYGALAARDASGRSLHTWLGLSGTKLLLHVDAAGARYPLSIDPLIQKGSKLSGGEAEARFGSSAALSADGSTLLIGAPQANSSRGAVWVFVREGSGTSAHWVQQGVPLTAPATVEEPSTEECAEESSEEAGECTFGSSVALSADGNTALIGDPSPSTTAGAAWIFTRSGTAWTRGPSLSGLGEGNEGRFGRSVALSADASLALVGVPSATGERGGAWTFTRSGSTWTRQVALLGSEASAMAHFGRSVALSGDGSTALIGGPGDSHYTGAAWTFARSGSTWTQSGRLTSGEVTGRGHFGKAVVLSADGSSALVGAQDDGEERGAVFTFARAGSTFVQLGTKLAGPELGAHFGASLALAGAGDEALIGAPRTRSGRGAATRYTLSGATWTPHASLGGTEAIGHGAIGTSVALSADGEVAAMGAQADNMKAGAAWVFSKQAGVPAPTVTDVSPSHGPTAGGITVTITGSNFPNQEEVEEAAPVVTFGSKPATSVKVTTAAEIQAVVPPAAAGVVDVRVQTAAGLSPISAAFRYEPGPKGTNEKESSSKKSTAPSGSGTTSSSTTTTAGAAQGVLGSTSTTSLACRVSLRSKHLVVALHTTASIRLMRTGTGPCRGTVTLRYKQKLTSKLFKVKSIGNARFTISPGKSMVLKIKLNKLGRALFAAGHGKLRASVAVLRTTPTPRLAKTASVNLSVKKTRKAAVAH